MSLRQFGRLFSSSREELRSKLSSGPGLGHFLRDGGEKGDPLRPPEDEARGLHFFDGQTGRHFLLQSSSGGWGWLPIPLPHL